MEFPSYFVWLVQISLKYNQTKDRIRTMKKRSTLFIILFFGLSFVDLFAFEVKGRGATFPAPLYQAWIRDYYNLTENQINFTPTGSGDGIKSARRRMVDFGASDTPLDKKLRDKYGLDMFPSVTGAIVLAYNLPNVRDNELKLTGKAIAGIFDGTIAYWDDATIKSNNPDLKLPHEKIIPIVRADKSGTTYNFTYYLAQVAPDRYKTSKQPEWKASTIGGKGNSGVSATISQLKYSIGYTEYSYKIELGLSAARIENKEGSFVSPTIENFQEAMKYASWSIENDFYAMIAYSNGKNAYPIVAATFILMPRDMLIEDKTNVARFFDYAFRTGDEEAIRQGYVPLPLETKNMIRNYWKLKGVKLW